MTKTWGAWRYYAPGYLSEEDYEIDSKVISEILSHTGFESIKAFNDELNSHERGNLPDELQARLKSIFEQTMYSEEEIPEQLNISDGIIASLEESIDLEFPFKLAHDHEPLEVDLYAMSIEDEDGTYAVNLRAGISSAKLLEPKSKDLEKVCTVLIDKLASGMPDELDSEDKDALTAYLESNGAEGSLIEDDDFLEELGTQVKYVVEYIGITTISFSNDSGDEVYFTVEGEEELGFNQA